MKQLLVLFMFLFVLYSCKKQGEPTPNVFLENIKLCLRDSLSVNDYDKLDFDRGILSNVDTVGRYYFRLPFKGMASNNEFLLVSTTHLGNVLKGKIIQLEGKEMDFGMGKIKRRVFNGKIGISSLDRKNQVTSGITNGYIDGYHSSPSVKIESLVSPDILPEVIVVAYISSGGISYSDWFNLESFASGSGTGGGYYSPTVGDVGGGATGNSSTSNSSATGSPKTVIGGGGIQQAPVIKVDLETQADNPPIDLQKFINCFNTIPDAGSVCSIEIFADIPVDDDSNKIFDFNSGSPGHTFIQIKKSNGNQSVIQNIGFYPKSGIKTVFTNGPVDSKFVDNGGHEFNASLKMSLTPSDLNSTLIEILYLKNSKYDIANFNCTDFSLDVFNKSRTKKLDIPLYDIPGNYPSRGTRMPQGLYNKLQQMKNNHDTEASNITIGISKGWVANSKGPCN